VQHLFENFFTFLSPVPPRHPHPCNRVSPKREAESTQSRGGHTLNAVRTPGFFAPFSLPPRNQLSPVSAPRFPRSRCGETRNSVARRFRLPARAVLHKCLKMRWAKRVFFAIRAYRKKRCCEMFTPWVLRLPSLPPFPPPLRTAIEESPHRVRVKRGAERPQTRLRGVLGTGHKKAHPERFFIIPGARFNVWGLVSYSVNHPRASLKLSKPLSKRSAESSFMGHFIWRQREEPPEPKSLETSVMPASQSAREKSDSASSTV